MTQEERALLEENEETVQVLLKLLKEIQGAYQLGLITCPLDERQLLIFRSKIEGVTEFLGLCQARLKRKPRAK